VNFNFKLVKIRLQIIGLFWGNVSIDNGVYPKKQATTKCDAEGN